MFGGVSNNRSSRVPLDQPLQVEKQVGQFYEQQLWQQVLASVLQQSCKWGVQQEQTGALSGIPPSRGCIGYTVLNQVEFKCFGATPAVCLNYFAGSKNYSSVLCNVCASNQYEHKYLSWYFSAVLCNLWHITGICFCHWSYPSFSSFYKHSTAEWPLGICRPLPCRGVTSPLLWYATPCAPHQHQYVCTEQQGP